VRSKGSPGRRKLQVRLGYLNKTYGLQGLQQIWLQAMDGYPEKQKCPQL
jgi:hypothetical protein